MRKLLIIYIASFSLSFTAIASEKIPRLPNIDTTKGYIIATSVNLREEPIPDGKIILILPIATAVRFVQHMRSDDFESSWSKVEVIHGPHLGKIGWVSAKYTGYIKPTIESLMQSHDSELACNFDAKKIWADRALALEPVKATIAIKSREVSEWARLPRTRTVLIASSDGGCCRTEAIFDTSRLSFKKFCELVNKYYYKKQVGSPYLDHTEWNGLYPKHGIKLQSTCPSEC